MMMTNIQIRLLIGVVFIICFAILIYFTNKLSKKVKKNPFIEEGKKQEIYVNKQKAITTYEWLEVEDFNNQYITLSDGKRKEFVTGFKIEPRSIALDSKNTQSSIIQRLRILYNKLKVPMTNAYVYAKPDLTEHLNQLQLNLDNTNDNIMNLQKQLDKVENDLEYQRISNLLKKENQIKEIIEDDLGKANIFTSDYLELNFLVLFKEKNPFLLENIRNEVMNEYSNAGFIVNKLSANDCINYFSDVFENEQINNYLIQNKTVVAPTQFKVFEDYLIVGDKYKRMLTVTSMPNFELGFFSIFLGNHDIKVFSMINSIDNDLNIELKREFQKTKQQYIQIKNDPIEEARLQKKIADLQAYIDICIIKRDKQWNLGIFLMLTTDSEEDLDNLTINVITTLRNFNVFTHNLKGLQENVFKYVTNLFIKDNLTSELKSNLGIPYPSTSIAGLYPYVFETVKDKNGFLFGHEKINGGAIIVDFFKYLFDKENAVRDVRANANLIVIGATGSGKSTALFVIIRNFIKAKIKTIWIDPENFNEKICRQYGKYINWGSGKEIINLFDLKPVTDDDDNDDDENDNDDEKYNTKIAIYNNIEDLKIVLKYHHPNITDSILSIVGEYVIKTYEEKGFDFNSNFKNRKKEEFPTFSHLYKVVDNAIAENMAKGITTNYEMNLLLELRISLKIFINEYSIYYDGITNLNIDDDILIGFGTKKLESKSKELFTSLNHIMFQFAWAHCSKRNELSALLIDEFSKYTKSPVAAETISKIERRSRKYWNMIALLTQETYDFSATVAKDVGLGIFNAASNKLIMKLENNGIDDLAKLIKLTKNEIAEIDSFRQGDGLLLLGNQHNIMHVLLTDKEDLELPK